MISSTRIKFNFRTIFRLFHIYYRIASLKELQISLGQPLINGRVGGDEEKNMADDGTTRVMDSIFDDAQQRSENVFGVPWFAQGKIKKDPQRLQGVPIRH